MNNNKNIPIPAPGVMVTRGGEKIQPFSIKPFEVDESQIDPKYKTYLLLLKYYDGNEGDGFINSFEIIENRKEVYKFLRDNIDFYDPNESLVMTDQTPLSKAITVVQFIKHLKDNELVTMEDGFDIMEYANEKSSEVQEREIEQAKINLSQLDYDELLEVSKKLVQ